MGRFKVVLIEHGYAAADVERKIVVDAGGEFIDADKLPLEEALGMCREADAVLCRRLVVTKEMLESFARCKTIIRYGIGTDNIDVDAATEAGIIVGHVPAYCLDEVSSHAVSLLLACVRQLVPTHKKMEQGKWDVHRSTPMWRMEGRTLGIVGLGKIGRTVARKLGGWGLRLLACDPYVDSARARELEVTLVDLETLCRESDYISLHTPLLPETRHLINRETLSWMKRGAVLVNTGRGPLVDTSLLPAALDAGQLGGVGLDVFEEEPLPENSPLLRHPGITVSDHVAWYSEESQRDLQRTVAEEAVRICGGGLPVSLANPEVLRRLGRYEEWTPTETVAWQLRRDSARFGR